MANLSDLIAQSASDNPQKLVNLALATQMMGSGSGLGGTNYVFVRGDGTPSENATELQAAYDLAKTMLPSSGNTVTVVVAPGQYDFIETTFIIDTPYINIVSLTGNADVILDGINVTANNVYLKGLNCGSNTFTIALNLDGLVCENCTGGDYAFGGYGGIASGTFINCTGGDGSFGTTASGTFTNCTGGNNSFGSGASGTFTNCTGGNNSFGSSTASGTFTNCTGGNNSFGSSTASGTFTNCTGGIRSFGAGGYASGTFKGCVGGNSSFGGGNGIFSSTGIATNCTGGDYSFGGGDNGTFSGIATNCTGGIGSFGGTISSAARLYYCRLTSDTFPTPVEGGKLVLCIDGDDTVVTTP